MKTKRIQVEVNRKLYSYLKELRDLGLHGSTVSQAAERLISDGVWRALDTGLISATGVKKLPKHK